MLLPSTCATGLCVLCQLLHVYMDLTSHCSSQHQTAAACITWLDVLGTAPVSDLMTHPLLQAYVGIVATLVCFYEALLERHMLPDWGFDWPGLAVSTTGIYSLSTTALSLLLVFRTNSSYQR